MPHWPPGGGCIAAARQTLALGQDVDEGLAVERKPHRPSQLGIVERRLVAIDNQIGADAAWRQLADRIRPLLLQVAGQRDRQRAGKGQLVFAGDKGEDRGRTVLDDRIFDAVEIGQARLPIIRVFRHCDVLVGLELDEFERTGADRMQAHLRWRYVTWIDRRHAGREQREKGGLRPLQHESHLVVAVGLDLGKIAVPALARVDAQLVGRLALHQFPGAFDVGGGERLAVVPLHPLAQLESQPRAVLVPRPTGRQLWLDRGKAVLRQVLVEDDEVVHHPHHRPFGDDRRFLVDRHRGRTVNDVLPKNAARFLGRRMIADHPENSERNRRA